MSKDTRSELLQYIEANATLHELATFATDVRERKDATDNLLRDLGISRVESNTQRPLGTPAPFDTKAQFEARINAGPAALAAADEEAATAERADVSPGKSNIVKIGSATTDQIMKILRAGDQPAPAFAEHCKLLWSRHQIKFDGSLYYL
jgi:hypothetical protein